MAQDSGCNMCVCFASPKTQWSVLRHHRAENTADTGPDRGDLQALFDYIQRSPIQVRKDLKGDNKSERSRELILRLR